MIRDITFLFHECADYKHIYGDNDYWSLLRGPYYEFFEEGESPDYVADIVAWVNWNVREESEERSRSLR